MKVSSVIPKSNHETGRLATKHVSVGSIMVSFVKSQLTKGNKSQLKHMRVTIEEGKGGREEVQSSK